MTIKYMYIAITGKLNEKYMTVLSCNFNPTDLSFHSKKSFEKIIPHYLQSIWMEFI